jgi:hypothetical protein
MHSYILPQEIPGAGAWPMTDPYSIVKRSRRLFASISIYKDCLLSIAMADDEKNECQVSEISSARTIKALNGIFDNCVSNSISNLISSCRKFQDPTTIVFHLILTFSLLFLE